MLKGLNLVARDRENQQRSESDGPALPPFVSFTGGMTTLVEALAKRLDRFPGVAVHTAAKLTELSLVPRSAYRLQLADGRGFMVRACLLATPAPITARLLAKTAPTAAEHLEGIAYASSVVVTVALATAADECGYGWVVPAVEGRPVIAVSFSSNKWDDRAVEDRSLARVFIGCHGGSDPGDENDETHIARALEELEIGGVTAAAVPLRVQRWPAALPQYEVGHRHRVGALQDALAMRPGLFLAGAYLQGIGVPDWIASGEVAAAGIERYLTASRGGLV